MVVNLQRLEAYYWAARLGGFGAAAAHLGLTQPSVSVRIRELEREVGTALFDRSSRNVRLTAPGAAMFDYVERVLTLLHDLEGHIGRGGRLRGLVRFGVPDSFALLCLAKFLKQLDRDHPDLNVAVTVDNSRVLSQKLEEGTLDVAILGSPPPSKLFRVEPLGAQPVSWVAGKDFRSPKRPLTPEDLVRRQIVTNPAPSPSFSLVMDWFSESGFVPTRLSTCSSISVIIGLVSAGAAISVLPTRIVQDQVRKKQIKILNFEPPLPAVSMFAAFPKRTIGRAAQEVVALSKNILADTGFVEN
ncbi:MAG TPA: LysR family transcriptional regulator [Pseudorhodoplanes sp.]|jgi:DNA-binding transcriptional LysR family regulator|nr:LysR family transcriptional regulator [Pseudorhodoplanes sp.]